VTGALPPLTFITAVPTGGPVGAAEVGAADVDVAICELLPAPLGGCTACPVVLLVHAVVATPANKRLMTAATAYRYGRIFQSLMTGAFIRG
jgi:hypothetical protein